MVIQKFDSGKNYTALLLSLFDELYLTKSNGSLYRIPIIFANKSRLYQSLARASTGVDKEYSLRVPIMSLSLNTWEANNDRKTSKMLKRKVLDIEDIDTETGDVIGITSMGVTWNDKPIDYSFTLTLLTKNLDDLTNISEAIISQFIDDVYYVDYKSPIGDVISTPVILESAEVNIDNNDEDYYEDRFLESKFEFKVQGLIHSQIQSTNKRVNTIDVYLNSFYNDVEVLLEKYSIPKA